MNREKIIKEYTDKFEGVFCYIGDHEIKQFLLSKIAEAEREAYKDMGEIAIDRINCIEGDLESGDSLHVAIRTAKDEITFALARRGIGEERK